MLFLKETVSLNETEQHIYSYITENMDKVIYMRIRELADTANVSPSTVLRFCRKFQCDGYSEFRYRLSEYVSKERKALPQNYDASANIAFMDRLTKGSFDDAFARATEILLDTDILFFVGIGGSGIAAEYGHYLFSSLAGFSICVRDPQNAPLYHLNERLRGHICVVALSVSGENELIMEYLEYLKQFHARIISITNSGNCSIAGLSDLNIACHIPIDQFQNMDTTSQIPTMSVLEALARYMGDL